MFFGLISIDKSEPEIVELKAPINVIGVSVSTSIKTIFKDAADLGKRYKSVKDSDVIRHKKQPWAFAAVSSNITDNGTKWEYLMGDVVESFSGQPGELDKFEIPPQTYAVFRISPRFSFLWGPTIGLTKKFIYTEWLPYSQFELDSDIVGDFEYHDERSLGKKPMIELYVSVKRK